MKYSIYFFNEDIVFNLLHRNAIKQWVNNAILQENKTLENINYIFCSDKYLVNINLEYLKHNTLTDIITFDQSDDKDLINADIYISVERVKENALKYKKKFYNELMRVMIHGVMHLCGYKDKTFKDKQAMRAKEDFYLMQINLI